LVTPFGTPKVTFRTLIGIPCWWAAQCFLALMSPCLLGTGELKACAAKLHVNEVTTLIVRWGR